MRKLCRLMKCTRQYLKKSKLIKPYERSVLQLLSVLLSNEEKDIINVKEKKKNSSLCRTFPFSIGQGRLACNEELQALYV